MDRIKAVEIVERHKKAIMLSAISIGRMKDNKEIDEALQTLIDNATKEEYKEEKTQGDRIDNITIEKEARIKYQKIVYEICNLFDNAKEKCTIDLVADKVKSLKLDNATLERLDEEKVWDVIESQVDKYKGIRNTDEFLDLLRECDIDTAICKKFGVAKKVDNNDKK